MDEKDKELLNHMKELESVPTIEKIGSFILWGAIIFFVIWLFK
jgi:hypothetical protein